MLYPILCKIQDGGQLTSWLASLTLEDEVRQDMSLPRVFASTRIFFRTSYRDYLHQGM